MLIFLKLKWNLRVFNIILKINKIDIGVEIKNIVPNLYLVLNFGRFFFFFFFKLTLKINWTFFNQFSQFIYSLCYLIFISFYLLYYNSKVLFNKIFSYNNFPLIINFNIFLFLEKITMWKKSLKEILVYIRNKNLKFIVFF